MIQNNPQQEMAIKTINKNLSVIAGAGTGKTKVLTERFVYILENGNLPEGREIESIVAITFTKKATQEMIERIRREIRKNFPKGEKWRRYYRDIEKANISTIHSFCLNILKENVIVANLDPMFEVIEEYEASKMLKDSIIEVLEAQIEEDEDTYNLFKIIKLDRTIALVDDFRSIYNEIRTLGMNIETIKDITIKHLETLEEINKNDLDIVRNVVKILIGNSNKRSKISKILDDEECNAFLNGRDIDDLGRALSYIEENIGANKKEQENIDILQTSIEKLLKSLERENIIYYQSILTILEKIDLLYKNKKEILGGLDYEDLQIKANLLLENLDIRKRYENKYKYIMIDEFQDTNRLQKQIFYKIASEEKDLDRNNLFIVGDPKQSIYGFRGADLDVFYDVVDDIENTINLDKNYRTVDTVLNFINNIFMELMKTNYSSLIPEDKSKGKIDIEVISKDNLIVPSGVNASQYDKYFEAEQIAKRIFQLVEAGEYQYKDFAMLFRATTRNYIYEKALNKYGIPYYNIGSKGFFKQQEILDLINALKFINNIQDKISTVGFLRSNFIGLDDNTIYYIFKNKDEHILDTMESLLEHNTIEEIEYKKAKSAMEIYREIYMYKDIYSISQILDSLLEKTLYIHTTLLKDNGRQKFANIYKFIEITKEYELKYTGNLNEFLRYIDEIKQSDESLGKIETENTDAVKILTIHKSKGLEFPVVVIPEMASRGANDLNKILYDESKGIAINLKKSNPIYNNIKKDRQEKMKEELKRVLYVAMTRAEKMLILGNQGRNSGFKKMIKDLLNEQEYKEIDEIILEPKKNIPVKLIPEELVYDKIGKEESVNNYLPILYDVKDYHKQFSNRVSISKYMVFRDCKRKYFLESNGDIPSIEDIDTDEELEEKDSKYELAPIQKGIVIHEFCESYRYGMDERELVEKILYKSGLIYNEETYKSLEKYIKNYLKHYNEDGDQIYYEKPFFLQLDSAYITGYIDKLIISDNKISILDFKTNKVYNKSKLIERYTPQIQLYAYAANKILNLPIKNASILFLENGENINIQVEEDALQRNIELIQEFIDFTIYHNSIDDYEESEKCIEYCKYKSLCNSKEEYAWETT